MAEPEQLDPMREALWAWLPEPEPVAPPCRLVVLPAQLKKWVADGLIDERGNFILT